MPFVGVGQPAAECLEAVGVEPGGADHGVDAVGDAELQVVHHHVGVGEVDDRLHALVHQCLDVVVDVDAGDQLEVALGLPRLLDGGAHLAADLAQRAQHAHLESHGVRLAMQVALSGAWVRDAGAVTERNVLGEELQPCGTDPVTGFYRDGCCNTGPEDLGSHTICAVVTAEFLDHQRSIGNDLSTPMPQFNFPGLVPGDRWCVTATNWARAHQAGAAAPVVLASTNEAVLDLVPLAPSASTQ